MDNGNGPARQTAETKRAEDKEFADDEWQYLSTSTTETEKAFDTWVLTLSGGTLGLSMTFLKDIAKGPIHCRWCLLAAWILLGLAICIVLVNLRLAVHSFARSGDILEEECEAARVARRGSVARRHAKRVAKLKVTRWGGFLNWVSLGSFFTAIVFLALFVTFNFH